MKKRQKKRPPQEIYLTEPHQYSPDSLTRLAKFVKLHHPFAWPEIFLVQCWTAEIERDGELEAAFWFSPVYDGVIEAHIVARPDVRGRWLSRSLLETLKETMIEHTKCRACIAQLTNDGARRVVAALGFKLYPGIAVFDVKEYLNGRSIRRRGTSPGHKNPDNAG